MLKILIALLFTIQAYSPVSAQYITPIEQTNYVELKTNSAALDYNDGVSTNQTPRTSSNIKLDGTTPATNSGASNGHTLRVESNQGHPTSISNAWTVKVTDGTDNVILNPVKENDNYNNQFGIIQFGVEENGSTKLIPFRNLHGVGFSYVQGFDEEGDSPTQNAVRISAKSENTGNVVDLSSDDNGKLGVGIYSLSGNRAEVDSNGNQHIEIKNNGSDINYNAGAPTGNTIRTVGPITDKNGNYYEFLGTGSTVSLPTNIIGGDGLYTATVDSLNRLSVNANIQFPEAVYSIVNLLNGTSPNMNVNGSGTPVTFQYSPPTGQTWYIENLAIFIADNANFPTGGFGGIGALANGLIIEFQSKGVLYTFSNIQNNGGILNTFSNHSISEVVSGLLTTDAFLMGSVDFQQRIALDQTFGDFFRVRVRDNLTGLTSLMMRVKVWRVN